MVFGAGGSGTAGSESDPGVRTDLGGEPVATVIGMNVYKTSLPQAALANGCFFNMLDLDPHQRLVGANGQTLSLHLG